jgi:hypothetical protein
LRSYPYGRGDVHYLTQDALQKLDAVDRLWNQLYPDGPSIGVGNESLSSEILYSQKERESGLNGTYLRDNGEKMGSGLNTVSLTTFWLFKPTAF